MYAYEDRGLAGDVKALMAVEVSIKSLCYVMLACKVQGLCYSWVQEYSDAASILQLGITGNIQSGSKYVPYRENPDALLFW